MTGPMQMKLLTLIILYNICFTRLNIFILAYCFWVRLVQTLAYFAAA